MVNATGGNLLRNENNTDIPLLNSTLMVANSLPSSTDFPNTTTLFIWNLDTSVQDAVGAAYTGSNYGGIGLTVGTAQLGLNTDVFGVSTVANTSAGAAYLNSADATLTYTGDMSFSVWAWSTTWNPAGISSFISRLSAVPAGFTFNLGGGTSTVNFQTYSGAAQTSGLTVSTQGLTTSAWHNFIFVRKGGVSQKMYIDGVLAGVGYDTTDAITAGGNLELFSAVGGANDFTGRLGQVVWHAGTAWSADQVKKTYARSAQRYAGTDPQGKPFVGYNLPIINGQKGNEGIITIPMQSHVEANTSNASSNGAFADVVFSSVAQDNQSEYNSSTGVFTCLESGLYQASWTVQCTSSAWTATFHVYSGLSKNNATTSPNFWQGLNMTAQAGVSFQMSSSGSQTVQLQAGDTLRIKYYANRAGGATTLDGTGPGNVLSIVKVA